MKLTDRTILITGGSAGIGLAFARKFLELGNQVIVTGRRQSALDEVRASYPKIHTIQSDVADSSQISSLAQRVKDDYPKLDVLMNNAGVMLHRNLRSRTADLDELTAEVDINVGGLIRTTSAFIDILSANKGTLEIRPGQGNLLALMRRVAPGFMSRQMWKASKQLVPVVVK